MFYRLEHLQIKFIRLGTTKQGQAFMQTSLELQNDSSTGTELLPYQTHDFKLTITGISLI